MDDCLVIGDVHGHYDRILALLGQEGILDAEGNRLSDATVIQLGDLGHFGMTRGAGPPKPKSPTADTLCYGLVGRGIDIVLWGNHDRAVKDPWHAFGGYVPPSQSQYNMMEDLYEAGTLRLAHEAHGFLLTHAGLHKSFKHNRVPVDWKTDPAALAEALNDWDLYGDPNKPPTVTDLVAIRDAISVYRGGSSNAGGILWRDAGESLFDGFRQIFGHTAKDKVRKYQTPKGYSYCIDTGTATNGQLDAIWLPSEKLVNVQCTRS